MANENSIPIKSPIALTGVFLDVLRARFAPGSNLPWTYVFGDDARDANTISIEAGGSRHTEDESRRPSIYVVRNPVQINQVAVGNRFSNKVETSQEEFYALAQTGFTFAIEAEETGESEQIADVVLSTIMMGSREIERAFLLRKLGPFAMSSVAKSRQDTEIYQTNIQVGLTYDVRWLTVPIAPLLQEIIVKARNSSYTNSDQYFIEIYQQSLGFRTETP